MQPPIEGPFTSENVKIEKKTCHTRTFQRNVYYPPAALPANSQIKANDIRPTSDADLHRDPTSASIY